MRLILDIDEKTLENMQGYCEQNNIPLEKMITSLFNKHIQEPADVFKVLNRDVAKNYYVLTELYNAYRSWENE